MLASIRAGLHAIGLTQGVRTFGWGLAAAFGGVGFYDQVRRSDSSTVEGLTGNDLIWIAGAIAVIVWLADR